MTTIDLTQRLLSDPATGSNATRQNLPQRRFSLATAGARSRRAATTYAGSSSGPPTTTSRY
jgi:hypothetical protein